MTAGWSVYIEDVATGPPDGVSELSVDRAEAPVAPPAGGGRLPSLTGLRCFAALGVFGFHYGALFGRSPGLQSVLALGYEGVPFFFVLSGFVLAWAHRPQIGPLRFYWHRFARIWPVTAAVTLLVALTRYGWTGSLPAPAELGYALSLSQAWTTSHFYAVNVVSWTLSCEVFFYLLFPFLIRAAGRLQPAALLALAALMDALTAGTRIWVAHHAYAPGAARLVIASPLALTPMFVVGVCTALLVRKARRPVVEVRPAALLCLGAFVLCWEWGRHPSWLGLVAPGIGVYDTVLIPFFAVLMAALAARDAAGGRSWFAGGGLVRLGEVSFAFYLLHVWLMDVFRELGSFRHPVTRADTLPLAGALCLTAVAAWALHATVERPMERRLRNVSASVRWRPREPVAGALYD